MNEAVDGENVISEFTKIMVIMISGCSYSNIHFKLPVFTCKYPKAIMSSTMTSPLAQHRLDLTDFSNVRITK